MVNLLPMLHSRPMTARLPTRLTNSQRTAWWWYPKVRGTDRKSNTNAYGRKGREKTNKKQQLYTNVAKKERTDHKCLWQRNKVQTTKCWWQTKKGCHNHPSKQLTPNERKRLKPPKKHTKRWPTCKPKVEKTTTINNTKSQRLILSGRIQSKPSMHRSKNNCQR